MSPRKSSTSSGKPPTPRPRYLAIEVAAGEPFPPRGLEAALIARLAQSLRVEGRIRVIRVEGRRALVEVPHRLAAEAREAWTGEWARTNGTVWRLRTWKTYGTLLKGKRWLASRASSARTSNESG